MRRTVLLLAALTGLGSMGLAQRALALRVSLPPGGLGVGLEAPLASNTAFRVYGDLFPQGPDVYLGGDFLFKPDLGQFDRDLRGIRPYFGGGLGVLVPAGRSPGLGLQIALGVEVLLEARTGLFLDGEYFYGFGGGRVSRLVLGANLR